MKKNIILTGFMGTGKTSIGRKLAELSGWEFYDTDQLIEHRENMSIGQILEEKEEKYFREIEWQMLAELLEHQFKVIATGGGTLLDAQSRLLALEKGMVFCLSASIATLEKRLANSKDRPLLGNGNLRDSITRVLVTRQSLYGLFPLQLDTTNLSVEQSANQIWQQYAQVSA